MKTIEERVEALEENAGCSFSGALMVFVVAVCTSLLIWHDPLEALRLALKAWLLR